MDVLKHLGVFWRCFGTFWDILLGVGIFWDVLEQLRMFCYVWVHFGRVFGGVSGHYGNFFDVLGHIGTFWGVLGSFDVFERIWDILQHLRMF